MLITMGGHKRMTIGNQPYEPVQVESVFIIEQEMSDTTKITDEHFVEMQNKINRVLDQDLERKVTETLKLQQKTRNRMKSLMKGDD
jgi:hypothetical protein